MAKRGIDVSLGRYFDGYDIFSVVQLQAGKLDNVHVRFHRDCHVARELFGKLMEDFSKGDWDGSRVVNIFDKLKLYKGFLFIKLINLKNGSKV